MPALAGSAYPSRAARHEITEIARNRKLQPANSTGKAETAAGRLGARPAGRAAAGKPVAAAGVRPRDGKMKRRGGGDFSARRGGAVTAGDDDGAGNS